MVAKLVMVEFLSVDGVMQGLGSPDEDREGGFEHGGWGARFADVLNEVLDVGGLEATSAYLLGRKTYEKMAAYWPTVTTADPMAASLNSRPKFVVTRSRPSLAWDGAVVIDGEMHSAVRHLKDTVSGDIVVLGSGQVARQLLDSSLVDELRLFIHPVLLGDGKTLFGSLPQPNTLTLRQVSATSKGTIAATYTF